MHLPGDGSSLACRRILERQHLDSLVSGWLSHRHACRPFGGIRPDLNAAPGVDVETILGDFGKLLPAVVVHTRPVIPVSAVGDLELNPADGIEWLLAGLRAVARAGTKDEH